MENKEELKNFVDITESYTVNFDKKDFNIKFPKYTPYYIKYLVSKLYLKYLNKK